ncbi:hypothetical protein [Halorhodospira neutriphila]|uniref:hypothetical protein n=1 Tax=Halorhodospira neutriphila TaxID=168379 RepID=UPI0019071F69|nr:hypothetical protein [Halorhodospira neutriphila]
MSSRLLKWGGVVSATVSVAGCATYGEGVNEALINTEKEQYEQADKKVKKALEAEGDDRLLYHLERGTIQHLAGNYKASNKALEKAHKLADSMRSKKVEDRLAAAMVNPRQGEYMGNDIERVYINYYKALNFLLLAQKAESKEQRASHLESASVEIRRLDNKLSSISFEEGTYEQNEESDKKKFNQLLKIFQKFRGNWLDKKDLIFREDAYVRYLAGLLYEKNGALDDARISYRDAAELYEEGYSEQYNLDKDMAQQAWLDTVRVMQKAGGYESEWRRLAKQKLTERTRERVQSFDPDKGQIVVIQHLGMVPQRDELNLHLSAVPNQKAFRLKQVATGEPQHKKDQLRWFYLLYADKGIDKLKSNMLIGYSAQGDLPGGDYRVNDKTVPVGPLWDIASELNIPQNIGRSGIRVTVPYYSPLRTNAGRTQLSIDGQEVGYLDQAESVSQLFIQNELVKAGQELRESMARATFKNVFAAEAGKQAGGFLGSLLAKVATSATSAAETRNWLTLPYDIRLARYSVEPGEHELTIETQGTGMAGSAEETISVKAGEIKVWVQRTFDPSQERSYERKLASE